MTELREILVSAIDEITQFGLQPNLNVPNKELVLEKHLVTIYKLHFEVEYEDDHHNYPKFDKTKLPDILGNIKNNFPSFGFYKSVLDINNMTNFTDIGLEDAIDDLNDIILELLEVKWRIENNSLNDGLYFFKFIFKAHINQHLLNLLNFMKQQED
ncbi:DUF5063 domain-containing protein [Emticicia sp. C21]|uniref:DUF5063 domain-containing protein n=1 Tax=Emticicia sp. C21 TaxID=2302915 RepID=UPI000E341869|nr:DUF5063 domain-containing protein [Emticicia sp. C21]RFS13534.1 DUF5063 domain-containing protein [Emticicia sp. C21]